MSKTDHSIAIYSIFGIGMVYFGCLMSRRFRVSVAKGGRGYFRPSYGRPKFTLFSKKKINVFEPLQKSISPKIFEIELSDLNNFFS